MFFCSKVCHWQKVEIRFITDPLRIYKGGPGVVRGGNEKKKADKRKKNQKRKLIKKKSPVLCPVLCPIMQIV